MLLGCSIFITAQVIKKDIDNIDFHDNVIVCVFFS